MKVKNKVFAKHSSELLEQLNSQRTGAAFCDMIVRVRDGTEFMAHRCVLAAASAKFHALACLAATTSMPGLMRIETLDCDELQPVLNFIYTGVLRLTTDNVRKVLTAATFLELPVIVGTCKSFIAEGDETNTKRETSGVGRDLPSELTEFSDHSDNGYDDDDDDGEEFHLPSSSVGIQWPIKREMLPSSNNTVASSSNNNNSPSLSCADVRICNLTTAPESQTKKSRTQPPVTRQSRSLLLPAEMLAGDSRIHDDSWNNISIVEEDDCFICSTSTELFTDNAAIATGGAAATTAGRKSLSKSVIPRVNKHSKLHQKQRSKVKSSDVFTCPTCGRQFGLSSVLTRHLRTHSNQLFQCKACDDQFHDPTAFKRHSILMHNVRKIFVCPFDGCKFRSDRLSNVEKHSIIHTGVHSFSCTRCGKTFAQDAGLRSHLQSCTQTRSFLCDLCGKAFNHSQSMLSHRRIHTSEKPFKCPDCNAEFADHRNYKRHRRIHDNAFPYECVLCDKHFRHSNTLKAHLAAHGILTKHNCPVTAWALTATATNPSVSPNHSVASSELSAQTPECNVQTPKRSIQTPNRSVQTPELFVQTPEHSVQTPKLIQTPKRSVQTPKLNVATRNTHS